MGICGENSNKSFLSDAQVEGMLCLALHEVLLS